MLLSDDPRPCLAAKGVFNVRRIGDQGLDPAIFKEKTLMLTPVNFIASARG